jgi:hypothetical protein
MRIPEDFLIHLARKADEAESDAGHGGRFDDGGASHLRELICAYRSGRDDSIPSFWVGELKNFERMNQEEYQLYLRLKTKYEFAK